MAKTITLSPKSKLKGLEKDLYNLEIRLKLQKKWVSNTESEIERVKELIEKEKNEEK